MPMVDDADSNRRDVPTQNWPSRPRSKKPEPRALQALRNEVNNLSVANNEMLVDGYLRRLRRLLQLRQDNINDLNDQGLRLMDRSIYAAFCDCIDIGQTEAAKAVLKNVRLTISVARVRSVRKGDKV